MGRHEARDHIPRCDPGQAGPSLMTDHGRWFGRRRGQPMSWGSSKPIMTFPAADWRGRTRAAESQHVMPPVSLPRVAFSAASRPPRSDASYLIRVPQKEAPWGRRRHRRRRNLADGRAPQSHWNDRNAILSTCPSPSHRCLRWPISNLPDPMPHQPLCPLDGASGGLTVTARICYRAS